MGFRGLLVGGWGFRGLGFGVWGLGLGVCGLGIGGLGSVHMTLDAPPPCFGTSVFCSRKRGEGFFSGGGLREGCRYR